MYEVWMIRKKNAGGEFSFYAYMSGLMPEWVKDKETAKHFKTENKAKKAFSEISPYALDAEIVKARVKQI